MDKADPRCSCAHHHIAPVAIILIGLGFLGNALGLVSTSFLAVGWPALLILAGVAKLMGRHCRCCTH